MKLFVKFMMFLLVLALAGPFLMKGPNGKPLLSFKDFDLPDLSLPTTPPEELSGTGEEAWIAWSKDKVVEPKVYVIDPTDPNQKPPQSRPGVFYRWKDKDGVWQFSNTPNPNTANIVVETDPNANVVQSLSTDKIDTALGRVREVVEPESEGEEEESSIPMPTTVPLAEVPDLINQAKAVQDLVNKRTEMLDKSL